MEAEDLWRKLEQARQEKAAALSRIGKNKAGFHTVIDEWKTRALIAEARLRDVEKLLGNERAARVKLATDKAKLEKALLSERDKLESRALQITEQARLDEEDTKDELRRMQSIAQTLRNKANTDAKNFERERKARLAAEVAIGQLEQQLGLVTEERNQAVATTRILEARIEMLEQEVLPRAKEDKAKLETQVQQLRLDLEDTIEAETAFRTLFLKEQSARRLRRSHYREELDST